MQNTEEETKKDKLLYFPLGKLSGNESIFQYPAKGIFTEIFKPIFTPILGKQLAVNTYYQNDLIAMANTPITIELLQTFDRLKINFKVNYIDITKEDKNNALYNAMTQIIQNKKTFMESIRQEDVPMIQSSVHQFINRALSWQKNSSFQTHFNKVQGYLDFANSVITSDEKYIETVASLKKIIEKEQKLFKLNKDNIGETLTHSLNTTWISLILAAELDDFDEQDYKKLSIICMVHDCGKALVPEEIIYKKGRLSHLELDIMKSHCLLSFILCSNNQHNLDFIAFTMGMHHVKENKDIPQSYGISPDTYTSFHDYLTLEAQQKFKENHDSMVKFYRLMSITDTFEAITAERVYKKASSLGKTIEIMLNENRKDGLFYTPYLDVLIDFVVIHFLPKNLIFKISHEILDEYYHNNEFISRERKFYQKQHRGVIVKPSGCYDKTVRCVVYNRYNKKEERYLDIFPCHLLQHIYFT
ncbi:MAG: HD domain-containing protein [Thermodesulfobacteriota bacterium]|nr:HD domain-containing protein [Thermodesulfobacteriota bacterium]